MSFRQFVEAAYICFTGFTKSHKAVRLQKCAELGRADLYVLLATLTRIAQC